MKCFEKIDCLLDLSVGILSTLCEMSKHFRLLIVDAKSEKFTCEGSHLYNIQILKLLKLSVIGLDIMELNSYITREGLNSINLKGFDINEIEYSNISKPSLNIIELGDNLDVQTGKSLYRTLISKYKEYDSLRSQCERILYYEIPTNLSPSNFIAWPFDSTPINKFGSSDEKYINGPYRNLIDFLQKERAKYGKKTIMNELYKEMANSVYGQTVRGIGIKNKLDAGTGEVRRMAAGELANPIIAS